MAEQERARGRWRGWFHPPVLRTEEEKEARHATWLELFFDLVFVAAVGQVSDMLGADPDAGGTLRSAALFIPLWWAWIGATFYADRFDTDDLGDRLLALAQMAAAVSMAVNVQGALEERGAAFALSYSAFRVLLVIQYLLAAWHVPKARALSVRWAAGFGLAALLWGLSALVPAPLRFALWGAGLLADFATPITAGRLHADVPTSRTHLPERFGLFTLIVLGEAIVGVVSALREHAAEPVAMVTGMLGLATAFALWWVYFENLDGSPVRASQKGRTGIYQVWLYAHLPLAAGLTGLAEGIRLAVETGRGEPLPDGPRWILCGGMALCLAALAVIHRERALAAGVRRGSLQFVWRLGGASAAVALGAFAHVGSMMLTGALAVLGILQIVIDPPNRDRDAVASPMSDEDGSGGSREKDGNEEDAENPR